MWPAVIPRSQVSGGSTTPLPHRATQSESLPALQPGAQHPSPLTHPMTGWRVHRASQSVVVVRFHVAQISGGGHPAEHEAGVLAVSHVSHGVSTTPLPQVAGQSVSTPAWAPGGQHPSPFRMVVVITKTHRALQVSASISRSSVHGTPSEQLRGHAPGPDEIAVSQVSPASSLPLPQLGEQSGSFARVHPFGQQPSGVGPHPVMGTGTHAAEHAAGDP
jgi:hypothetical protein